jgi:hypothetical protein
MSGVMSPFGEVHRYGVHHHLHHAEAGDEQAPLRRLAFLLCQLLGAPDVVGMGSVADRGDRFEDRGKAGNALIPTHPGTSRGVVDVDRRHAGLAAHVRFIEPDAGGAGDALEDQRRFLLMLSGRPLGAAHEVLLHVGMIEQAEIGQNLRHASRGLSGSASRCR